MKSLPIIFGGGNKLSALPLNGYMTAYPYGGAMLSPLYVLISFFCFFRNHAGTSVRGIHGHVSTVNSSKHTVKAIQAQWVQNPVAPLMSCACTLCYPL